MNTVKFSPKKNKKFVPAKKGAYEQPPARLAKKREHCEQLANSIRALRGNLTRDMKSDDEKVRLTALIIAIIDKTAERIGNEESEGNGHFGVTGFRKKHISISGNTVTLNYKGKSGVIHEKKFTDELIASTLKQAIKDTPKRSIFVTSDGFRIKADRVNRYLSEYDISAKDLRGYHANKYIIDKLHKQEISPEIKDRKVVFKKAVRYSAARVGHAPMTLQKHYLFPELQVDYVDHGKIINLSDFYSGGGEVAVKTDSMEIKKSDIGKLDKSELKVLIDQLEGGMSDLIKSGDSDKVKKMNILIGDVIDAYEKAPDTTSGEIKGPSHADGGVPMIVKPSDTPIEVEGKEYFLCADVFNDDSVYEFHDVTNKEVLDAIFQMEGCKYNPKIAHNNDFIVCKLATQDKKVRDYKGTIGSILNKMQAEYGCKLTSDNKMTIGGPVGISLYPNVDIFVDEIGVDRFEIYDTNITLDLLLFQSAVEQSIKENKQVNIPCEQLITDWDGYDFYPELKQINIRFLNEYPYENSFVSFDKSLNEIFVNSHKFYTLNNGNEPTVQSTTGPTPDRLGSSSNLFRRTIHGKIIHELQHAIQRIEGFEITLSNPAYILSELKAKYRRSYMSDFDFKQWIEGVENLPYRTIEYNFYMDIPSEREALLCEKKVISYYDMNSTLKCGGSVQDVDIFTLKNMSFR
jgi:hypothetical protein